MAKVEAMSKGALDGTDLAAFVEMIAAVTRQS
jgi:hypothetical protein